MNRHISWVTPFPSIMGTLDPTADAAPRPTTSLAPLVSVIIPSRDRPDRVTGAIESVLAQSYPNLQILVVDDGSTLPLGDVLGPWLTSADHAAHRAEGADPHREIELVRLPVPVGAAAARNVGLARARGDFVAFLDDDDRFEEDKVAEQVAFFERFSDHGLVTCHYFAVDETSRRAPTVLRPPRSFTAGQLLWANFAGSFSQVMLRRSRLGDAVSIDEGYESVEDWDLWLRCVQRAPAGTVPRPLVRYVSHPGPRLSDPALKRAGLERFYERYSYAMSPSCRSFHRAHRAMEVHGALHRRLAVARALVGASPGAWPALVGEQLARQCGRLVGDPGLSLRALAAICAERDASRNASDGASSAGADHGASHSEARLSKLRARRSAPEHPTPCPPAGGIASGTERVGPENPTFWPPARGVDRGADRFDPRVRRVDPAPFSADNPCPRS